MWKSWKGKSQSFCWTNNIYIVICQRLKKSKGEFDFQIEGDRMTSFLVLIKSLSSSNIFTEKKFYLNKENAPYDHTYCMVGEVVAITIEQWYTRMLNEVGSNSILSKKVQFYLRVDTFIGPYTSYLPICHSLRRKLAIIAFPRLFATSLEISVQIRLKEFRFFAGTSRLAYSRLHSAQKRSIGRAWGTFGAFFDFSTNWMLSLWRKFVISRV